MRAGGEPVGGEGAGLGAGDVDRVGRAQEVQRLADGRQRRVIGRRTDHQHRQVHRGVRQRSVRGRASCNSQEKSKHEGKDAVGGPVKFGQQARSACRHAARKAFHHDVEEHDGLLREAHAEGAGRAGGGFAVHNMRLCAFRGAHGFLAATRKAQCVVHGSNLRAGARRGIGRSNRLRDEGNPYARRLLVEGTGGTRRFGSDAAKRSP